MRIENIVIKKKPVLGDRQRLHTAIRIFDYRYLNKASCYDLFKRLGESDIS